MTLQHNTLYNMDCMEGMAQFPDKYFELAIVDPPYRDSNQPTQSMRDKIGGNMKHWAGRPDAEYFKELFRVSQNQIVWGANNFIEHLYSTNCFLFWYKNNPMENYSDGELAWTSFEKVAKCINIPHFGAHTADKVKIHPTQKPVKLYRWLLSKYAKPGDKILDTHVGSASSLIACLDMGHEFVGFELDEEYYKAAIKRMNDFKSQLKLFT